MKITIFKRLVFSYAAIMLMIIFIGIYLPLKLKQINDLTRNVAVVDEASIRIVKHLQESIYAQIGFGNKFLISRDKDFFSEFEKIQNYTKEDIIKIESLLDTSEKEEAFTRAKKLYFGYLSKFTSDIEMLGKDPKYPGKKYIE